MKAVVLEDQKVITYKEVPTPELASGHVRVKVKAVSICGSDIKRYVDGHRMYSLILGHECAGVVDKVGQAGFAGIALGEPVRPGNLPGTEISESHLTGSHFLLPGHGAHQPESCPFADTQCRDHDDYLPFPADPLRYHCPDLTG